jgi:ribosomal protein S18 acetylase RimI-like enzyme
MPSPDASQPQPFPPSTIQIAALDVADAAELSALFGQILRALPYYNERAQAAELTKYSAAGLKELIRCDPGSVFVAKVGSKLIGYCFSSHDDALVWMAWIAVHPDYRRTKVASALIQTLEARAQSLGSHKIWCDCRTENEPSKLTLLHNGFRQICTIRNHWFGQDFILWEKFVPV